MATAACGWRGRSSGRSRANTAGLSALQSSARSPKSTPESTSGYVGHYEFKINPQRTITFAISTDGGKLFVQPKGGMKREWLPASETEFFSVISGNTLVFATDAGDAVNEVTLEQDGESYTGKRIK